MKRQLKEELYSDLPEETAKWKHRLFNNLTMIGILAATVFFTEILRLYHIGNQSLIMIYFLSVLIISRVTTGYVYSIVATLVSTLAYDWLITAPRLAFSFTIGSPITLVTMLIATFITSTLTMQMKTQARLAQDREHRTQLLYEINQRLLGARDVDTIIRLTNEYLIGHLRRAVIFYSRDPFQYGGDSYSQLPYENDETDIFHAYNEQKIVHSIFNSKNRQLEPTSGESPIAVYYIPVTSRGNLLGLIGISCRSGSPLPGNIMFAQMLTGQITPALELQYMVDEQNRILVEAEKEKMRATLLRAISHDLRTPMTSILGASSTILDQPNMDMKTTTSLVLDIKETAQWLIRMVENLLTITRITKDTSVVSKTLEAAEEVIGQSVSIVRKRFPKWKIRVSAPDELLMVPMDATLISQVIINLLENAVKNSPAGSSIHVTLTRQGMLAQIAVSDQGTGISNNVLENLFDVHYHSKVQIVDSVRGIGIGLSICQTIVTAHGGTIGGYNKEEGGAIFWFQLPLEEGELDSER